MSGSAHSDGRPNESPFFGAAVRAQRLTWIYPAEVRKDAANGRDFGKRSSRRAESGRFSRAELDAEIVAGRRLGRAGCSTEMQLQDAYDSIS
jgi:hypothetical protein